MPGDIWLTFPNGTEHELTSELTIGRAAENNLTLASKSVSRQHAAVVFREGRWFVEDRGSFNGTFVNGTRVHPGVAVPLRHADRIGVGSESLLFSWPAQVHDPESTDEVAEELGPLAATLSPFQTQVLNSLCGPWLAGASLESLPSNEQIAGQLGTPGASDAVKAALRRIYAKAGLANQPPHAKRRALCRVARQRGWI